MPHRRGFFMSGRCGLPSMRASLLSPVVTEPPVQPRRHFLPWDRPLLSQAVDFLAAGWSGKQALDLTGVLIVVSTRQAGRRLREALAVHAAKHQQAVFAPRVLGPDQLIQPPSGEGVASPLESLLVWTEVLREIDPGGCRAVIPVDPPERNFAWALGLARTLMRVQQELAEGGLRLADVGARAGEFAESERWRQLGALEQLHAARLGRDGLADAQAAKIAGAQNPVVPAGVKRIVIIAVPDPLPLAVQILAAYSRSLPVEVVVHAPSTEAAQFDEWGRPRPEAWARRVLDLPDFESRVQLEADPAAQAARLVLQARAYAGEEGKLAAGVADGDVLPVAESALRAAGLPVFNPEGRLRRQEGFYHLLAALSALAKAPEFSAVAALARCPDVLAWLKARRGAGFSAVQWLAGLDELHARHLPADLEGAEYHALQLRSFPALAGELAEIRRLREWLTTGPFSTSVAAALGELFSSRSEAFSRGWTEAAETWMEIVRQCAQGEERRFVVERADWWQIALSLFGDSRSAEEKPARALELQGWLELPWEDAPHLVVAGLNDGRVPEAVAGDAFLPESLRVKLGLKSNEVRFARDAFLLQTLASSRSAEGRLDLLFGKFSAEGEPLRPSRLLLRCADPELPARVHFLFRAPALPGPAVAWRRAWRLTLPRRDPPTRVAVTALKRWLRCPLRFYLQQVLGMQAVDPGKSEMDAFDFGTLCHGSLEAMARDAAMRECTEAGVIRDFLLADFERRMTARYGRALTLPLLVQQESARQRLSRAAEVQAGQRAEGWVITEVERKFELPVEGIVIAGKIDRIERHEKSGAWRVLDYKTSDSAVDPAKAHLRGRKDGEDLPDWACWTGGAKPRVWSDLQLPLYRRVLAAEADGAPLECGYFNLPKAAGETGLRAWEEFSADLEASAWNCAKGVVSAIKAGKYSPPIELSGREAEFDEFASLFHGGAAASIRWEEPVI
ncbi:PD-(D/E)XK nuclease family protein [Oleiharenicola lentus]|uniref:PD-(D/E)XK nuclease family protein n=1 Tax=Oleiharenicola lentus TaxID=2508720 RepID=A0A4Q1C858_9BACT|nr:PD-(D/E)XK nuclease family protein [Oleiharenicola lentus]RXK55026.1 PD-(D/E)XK nuclease family protein [Oleiharenicola lentus]